jgi:hypothetical protein
MLAALVSLFFLPSEYRKKKLFIAAVLALAFSIGYEPIMDEPVTKLPGRISRALNKSGPEKSENAHYYKTPPSGL